MSGGRDTLLDRCVQALLRRGIGDLSLREIAAEAGTSHRMLIYHFGSRDGLLAAVVGRVEADQRAALESLPGDPLEASRAFWERLTDPALAPAERLFFEIYAQALRGRDWTTSFRESVIDAWEEPVAALYQRLGASPETARAHVRLGLAVTRGLLMDLLLTDDREVVAEAMELFGSMVAASVARVDT
jgi:AcrR family transcriptional regulator